MLAFSITESPTQKVVEPAGVITAVITLPTSIVIVFEIAGDPETHVAFEVISHVIISPFANVDEV